MKGVPVPTTYLEMLRKPKLTKEPHAEGAEFERRENITTGEYLDIYRAVGEPYGWFDRVLMDREEPGRILNDPGTEVFFLKVDGDLAGYSELDRRDPGNVEIAFLGLKGEFQGRGLGRYLLHRTLEEAWRGDPKRVWLHTCEWDHRAALHLYIGTGFGVFKQGIHMQKVPDDFEG
ncbi:hypothetical protein B6U90_07195 [Thermoplasmatales archaeon ex4484_6]|nr:MAG: hypothetical protein B6U90_07195 [Thermoplasmatales archaeon ex4484_6]RLF68461.1 MAG: hypothetical protein DRN57_03990 [Thermoplasmata archaeon]